MGVFVREFLFLRHGETDWNLTDRIQGQIGFVPLNDAGQKQAAKAAEILKDYAFDLIVSSTLDRAAMTARIISAASNRPVSYDVRLIERACGLIEGMTLDDIRHQYPEVLIKKDDTLIWSFDLSEIHGAETRDVVADRAVAAMMDLLSLYDGKRLLIVSHGGWMKGLVYRLTGTLLSFKNAFPYKAYETQDGWVVEPLV